MKGHIEIIGATTNNLKNLSLRIPKHALTVLCGPSGAGKTSLAIDTLAAEGNRRLEALAQLSRGNTSRPRTVSISNLPMTLAMKRKLHLKNRHNVLSFLGLDALLYQLFMACGKRPCPLCGAEIRSWSLQEMTTAILESFSKRRAEVLAVITHPSATEVSPEEALNLILDAGYAKAYIGDRVFDLNREFEAALSLCQHHPQQISIEAVIDNFQIDQSNRSRLTEALRFAERLQKQGISIRATPAAPQYFSQSGVCQGCGRQSFGITARHFGLRAGTTADLIPPQQAELLSIKIGTQDLGTILTFSMEDFGKYLNTLQIGSSYLPAFQAARRIIALSAQLGLGHLGLMRPVSTLSLGETTRLRLSKQFQEPMQGLLYILDEPTLGLHPHDVSCLLETLRNLRDQGNSVLAVEHHPGIVSNADYLIELGPGAGRDGGSLVRCGPISEAPTISSELPPPWQISKCRHFENYVRLEGACLHNLKHIKANLPLEALSCVSGVSGSGKSSLVMGTLAPAADLARRKRGDVPAAEYQKLALKSFSLDQPVSGVVTNTLGEQTITQTALVATYCGVFDFIREAFAGTLMARMQGYTASHFALSHGKHDRTPGFCKKCRGLGVEIFDSQSGEQQSQTCPECHGLRFNKELLKVKYKQLSISEFLSLCVDEALSKLEHITQARACLQALTRLGLGYLNLGQPLCTLSSGELQRLRLAVALKPRRGSTLYLLDEPSAGLTPSETRHLAEVLHQIRSEGHTIIAIEHNLELIGRADYILDLGPGAGPYGGEIVFQGTPAQLCACQTSLTGQALKSHFSAVSICDIIGTQVTIQPN
ncbi:MAG: hypothetical protein GX589_04985 [Deltaproteobacteria bacterium]|nr:hypothetical protein [Deltaproteobacteria bacterium]